MFSPDGWFSQRVSHIGSWYMIPFGHHKILGICGIDSSGYNMWIVMFCVCRQLTASFSFSSPLMKSWCNDSEVKGREGRSCFMGCLRTRVPIQQVYSFCLDWNGFSSCHQWPCAQAAHSAGRDRSWYMLPRKQCHGRPIFRTWSLDQQDELSYLTTVLLLARGSHCLNQALHSSLFCVFFGAQVAHTWLTTADVTDVIKYTCPLFVVWGTGNKAMSLGNCAVTCMPYCSSWCTQQWHSCPLLPAVTRITSLSHVKNTDSWVLGVVDLMALLW